MVKLTIQESGFMVIISETEPFTLSGQKMKSDSLLIEMLTPKHSVNSRACSIRTGIKSLGGDIVDYHHVWGDREWQGHIIYSGHRFEGDGFYMTHHDDPTNIFEEIKYVEVVGNIHDNPELNA